MVRKYHFNVVAILFGLFVSSNSFATEFVEEISQVEYNIVRASDRYIKHAKRDPTLDNLIHTITVRYERGESNLREVLSALELLGLKEYENPDAIKSVVKCFGYKDDFGLIKTACVQTLGALDREVAVTLAHELLKDNSLDLSHKLSVVDSLLYWGYEVDEAIIQKGQASSNQYSRMLANKVYSNCYGGDGLVRDSRKSAVREKSGMIFGVIFAVACVLSALLAYLFIRLKKQKMG